jgi:hypothetical protein
VRPIAGTPPADCPSDDQIDVGRDSANNVLGGEPNRDLARLEPTTSATTCTRIERITGFDGNPRTCA